MWLKVDSTERFKLTMKIICNHISEKYGILKRNAVLLNWKVNWHVTLNYKSVYTPGDRKFKNIIISSFFVLKENLNFARVFKAIWKDKG